MSDSESSCGLEMISSRLEREAQKKRLYEVRLADPIFSSIGQLGKYQFKLMFLLSLIKFPATLIEITGKISTALTNSEEFLTNNNDDDDDVHGSNIDLNFINFEYVLITIGLIFGYFIFGILGDIRGRKPCLAIALFIQTISSLISSFVPWSELFIVLHFITSFASGGVLILSFILMIEFIGPSRRDIMIILYLLPTGLSYVMFVTIEIWFHTLQKIVSILVIPLILSLFLLYLIPESPEWFFIMGSINRLSDILINTAKRNNLPYEHIQNMIIEAQKRNQNNINTIIADNRNRFHRRVCEFFKLFFKLKNNTNNDNKSKLQLLCISSSWILLDLYLYKETINIFYEYDNSLIKITIYGTSFIIGIMISYPLLKLCGIKITIISNHLIIAFTMLLTLIIPKKLNLIKILLYFITMISTGILYSTIYIYSIQQFNSIKFRCTLIGILNGVGKLVSIIIYLILMTQQNRVPWLIPIIYGLMCIIASAMILCLPSSSSSSSLSSSTQSPSPSSLLSSENHINYNDNQQQQQKFNEKNLNSI